MGSRQGPGVPRLLSCPSRPWKERRCPSLAHPCLATAPSPEHPRGHPDTQRNQLCPSCGCSVPQVPLPDAPQTLGPEQSRVAKLAGPEGTWKLEKELSLVHRDEDVTASRGCPGRKETEERSGSPTCRGPRRDVMPRCRP